MSNLLHSQLENERAIYNKLKAQNRKDLVAQILLERIEREIETLERKVNVSQRKENAKHGYRRGFIQFIREAMHRRRDIEDSSDSPIHSIPAIATT